MEKLSDGWSYKSLSWGKSRKTPQRVCVFSTCMRAEITFSSLLHICKHLVYQCEMRTIVYPLWVNYNFIHHYISPANWNLQNTHKPNRWDCRITLIYSPQHSLQIFQGNFFLTNRRQQERLPRPTKSIKMWIRHFTYLILKLIHTQ